MNSYSGKNAVVTGGSSGMGFAIARLLVDGGARVAITGRSQQTLDAAREQLGDNAIAVRGDVASLPDLDALADRVKTEFGTVEALFVNAGVVFTTSAANVMGVAGTSVYSAGKAALRSLARGLSRELLPRRIRVNAVSPGPIDTGVLEKTMPAEAAEQFKAEQVAGNPMRRFSIPEEVARAAAFLAFDATYTAGAELAVDGGTTQL